MNVYVDTSKVPGGAKLHDSFEASKTQGIPWFVVLDSDGKEIANSNGPKGNIGHPDTDEEIEVFIGIVKKVALTITDDDRAALKKALVDHRAKK